MLPLGILGIASGYMFGRMIGKQPKEHEPIPDPFPQEVNQ